MCSSRACRCCADIHDGAGEAALLPRAAATPARSPRHRGGNHGIEPAAHGGIGSDIEIPGKTSTEKWNAIFQLVSEGYFQTLGLRLQRGRPLSESDVNGARRVAVVNQTLVNRHFGHEDPIGRQIRFKLLETEQPIENPVFEIIGVVSDAKNQASRIRRCRKRSSRTQ
jgi:hypothetical protein